MAPSFFDKYRIVLLASEGLTMGQIAEVMDIAKSVVTYVVNKWRKIGLVDILRTVKNKANHPKACFTVEYH
jgi:predicted transcriptional regulator